MNYILIKFCSKSQTDKSRMPFNLASFNIDIEKILHLEHELRYKQVLKKEKKLATCVWNVCVCCVFCCYLM